MIQRAVNSYLPPSFFPFIYVAMCSYAQCRQFFAALFLPSIIIAMVIFFVRTVKRTHTHRQYFKHFFVFDRYFASKSRNEANNQHPGGKRNKTLQNGRRDWAKENTENPIKEQLAINLQLLL